MAGKIVHFEVPAKDTARAKKFYSSLFGYKIKDAQMPGMEDWLIDTGSSDLAGGLFRSHLLDRLIEIRAKILAELAPHALRPFGDGSWILLIDVAERRRIGEVLEPRLLRTDQAHARRQAGNLWGAAVRARRWV